MNLGFNGCIRSRVGELEAAIFSTLLRTTASSVARSSSCCRIGVSWLVAFEFSGNCRSRVFQGLRAPFSPVARGNWKLSLLSTRLLVLRAKVKVSSKVSFFLASFCYFVA
ncbi:hypothetical protein YC2023_025537 [Brassica napus]